MVMGIASHDNAIKTQISPQNVSKESPKNTQMNREALIQSAMQDQRHQALESDTVPYQDLPDDLLNILVTCKSSEYRIHGFSESEKNENHAYVDGKRVSDDRCATLSRDPLISVNDYDEGTPFFTTTRPIRKVPLAKIEFRKSSSKWWYAVIEGNGIILERDLKERGFDGAFAGSATTSKSVPYEHTKIHRSIPRLDLTIPLTMNRKKARASGPAISLGDLIGSIDKPATYKPECRRKPHRFAPAKWNRVCARCGVREEKINGAWARV